MRPLLEAGQDILFIGMSSGVSGSFQAGMVAAAQLRAEFPERSIELIDTLGASLGEGLVVLRAAELRDSGIALSAAVHLLSDYRDRICQVFTVDNLKYLCSTGRLSNAKAAIGNILNIKPLLKGDSKGKSSISAKFAEGNTPCAQLRNNIANTLLTLQTKQSASHMRTVSKMQTLLRSLYQKLLRRRIF